MWTAAGIPRCSWFGVSLRWGLQPSSSARHPQWPWLLQLSYSQGAFLGQKAGSQVHWEGMSLQVPDVCQRPARLDHSSLPPAASVPLGGCVPSATMGCQPFCLSEDSAFPASSLVTLMLQVRGPQTESLGSRKAGRGVGLLWGCREAGLVQSLRGGAKRLTATGPGAPGPAQGTLDHQLPQRR